MRLMETLRLYDPMRTVSIGFERFAHGLVSFRRVALVVVVGLDVPERFRELLSQVCHVGPPQGVE
jgi:hypothetical protein